MDIRDYDIIENTRTDTYTRVFVPVHVYPGTRVPGYTCILEYTGIAICYRCVYTCIIAANK